MENDGQQNHHVEQTPQSELAVIVAACWSVVKSRKSTYFPRVLDFIECVYRRAPDLLHYRHYAKLSLGLCARITLDLIAKEGTNDETWRTCQQLFLKIVPDATLNVKHRDLWKVQSAKVNFQKMVQRLFEDEEFRNCYMKEQVAEDYGEAFVAVLENLLRELLVRLNTALYENSSQQLLSALERFDIQTDSVSHSELMKTPNPQSRKIVKPLLNNKQRQKRLT